MEIARALGFSAAHINAPRAQDREGERESRDDHLGSERSNRHARERRCRGGPQIDGLWVPDAGGEICVQACVFAAGALRSGRVIN